MKVHLKKEARGGLRNKNKEESECLVGIGSGFPSSADAKSCPPRILSTRRDNKCH